MNRYVLCTRENEEAGMLAADILEKEFNVPVRILASGEPRPPNAWELSGAPDPIGRPQKFPSKHIRIVPDAHRVHIKLRHVHRNDRRQQQRAAAGLREALGNLSEWLINPTKAPPYLRNI